MAEPTPDTRTATDPARRRGPDPLTLFVGVLSLVLVVTAVVTPDLIAAVDPRLLLAGTAVVVGLGALLATVRR